MSSAATTSRPRRRGASLPCLALLCLAHTVAAFSSPPRPHLAPTTTTMMATATRTTPRRAAPKHSPLEDEPWQDDDSYWDMLQAASKDPETFEKFIEESMARRKGKSAAATAAATAATSSINNNGIDGANGAANGDAPKKRKYVPIEEWDAQRKDGENMSAEERLQWECQRGGDRFRQNEILRHNLKSF